MRVKKKCDARARGIDAVVAANTPTHINRVRWISRTHRVVQFQKHIWTFFYLFLFLFGFSVARALYDVLDWSDEMLFCTYAT